MYQSKNNIGSSVGFVPQMVNAGGMTDLVWLFPIGCIAEMPEPKGVLAQWGFLRVLENPAHIIFKPSPNSLIAIENLNNSQNGNFWSASINFDMPYDGVLVGSMVDAVNEVEFVAVVRDANGICKLYGTNEFPLKLNLLEKTPGERGGKNSCTWNIAGDTKKNASYLQFDAMEMGYITYPTGVWITKKRNVFDANFDKQFGDYLDCIVINL